MDLETLGDLYLYNSWANEQTLQAASRLSAADFDRDLKGSYCSVRETLTHIVWAEWIWLQRWKGVSPTVVFPAADYPTVDSLRRQFEAVATERSAFLRGRSAEQILQVVEYTNRRGQTWRYPLWQQLYHVVNHSTYHRGQVATMLRQLGAAPAATDLLVYYDQK